MGMKFRLVLESESVTDLGAVAQLADEKGIFFDRIEKIAGGRRKIHRVTTRVNGKSPGSLAEEALYDTFKIGERFPSNSPKLYATLARFGMKPNSSSPMLTRMKDQGRANNPERGIWTLTKK